MKLLITSLSVLVATTAVATAQLNGFSTGLLSGAKEIGMVAPNPSTCGIIGAVVLIAVIGARRLQA